VNSAPWHPGVGCNGEPGKPSTFCPYAEDDCAGCEDCPGCLDCEEWRDVTGYHGYQASSLGRVRSVLKASAPPRMMKAWVETRTSRVRYCVLKLTVFNKSIRGPVSRKKRISMTLNRVVCLAFHGRPHRKTYEASHLDGNTMNNRPANLAWESRSQNRKRQWEHGNGRAQGEHGGFVKQ